MFNLHKNSDIPSQNHYVVCSVVDSIEFPVIKVKMVT